PHPGGQGPHRRHPAGTAAAGTGPRRARPRLPAAGRHHRPHRHGGVSVEPRPRMGFFTDTSVCIGCKACEVACKEWNTVPEDGIELTGMSYDNSVGLSADTWRHVAFIEQRKPVADGKDEFRWLMASDVCKHCTHAA